MSTYFLVLLGLISPCCGARILVAVPFPSSSHHIVFQPIWKELVHRGHDVVLLTPYPSSQNQNVANLREIDVSVTHNIWRKELAKIVEEKSAFYGLNTIFHTIRKFCEEVLQHPEVLCMIHDETEHFDLVIAEIYLRPMLAFKTRFDCPIVVVSSLDCMNVYHRTLGNAVHPFLNPDIYLDFNPQDGFFSRLAIFFVSTFYDFYWWDVHLKEDDNLIEKYFGPGQQPLKELLEHIDLAIININSIAKSSRLVGRNTVIISGLQIQDPKPLPQNLEQFLNASKSGVIYFSLGTNVKSAAMPNKTKSMFIKVFSELPYDVLWKFETDELPGKPDNVKIMKWIPQQDVLRHPNVKLFINQGGLQSFEEALFNCVPMLDIPFYADQMQNAKKIESMGLGVMFDGYKSMTEKGLKEKIVEVIENPKYRQKIKEISLLVNDEPMTALETAVWWTEYVLRHKGAQHLRGPTVPFVQHYFLDVIAFLAVMFSIVLYISYRIIKRSRTFCTSILSSKQKEQ